MRGIGKKVLIGLMALSLVLMSDPGRGTAVTWGINSSPITGIEVNSHVLTRDNSYRITVHLKGMVEYQWEIRDRHGWVFRSGGKPFGNHSSLTVQWDGRDQYGNLVDNGEYDFHLTTKDQWGKIHRLRQPFGVVSFQDLAGNWARPTIEKLVVEGTISGYLEDDTFRPGNPITRQDFAILVARYLDLQPSGGYRTRFTDVRGAYGRESILALEEAGILSGYRQPDGSYRFHPGAEISREETAVLFAKLLGYDGSPQSPGTRFGDIGGWSKEFIKFLESKGKVSGYREGDGGYFFRPKAGITRGETAFLLQQIGLDEVVGLQVPEESPYLTSLKEAGQLTSYRIQGQTRFGFDLEGEGVLLKQLDLYGESGQKGNRGRFDLTVREAGDSVGARLEVFVQNDRPYVRHPLISKYILYSREGVSLTVDQPKELERSLRQLLKGVGYVGVGEERFAYSGREVTVYRLPLTGTQARMGMERVFSLYPPGDPTLLQLKGLAGYQEVIDNLRYVHSQLIYQRKEVHLLFGDGMLLESQVNLDAKQGVNPLQVRAGFRLSGHNEIGQISLPYLSGDNTITLWELKKILGP